MATERTAIDPFGGTIYFDTAEEDYIDPFGGTVNGDVTATAGTGSVHTLAGSDGLAGPGGIAGPKGGLAN